MSQAGVMRAPVANAPVLDVSLRDYLDTNADIVTRINKPVSIDDRRRAVGAERHTDPVREHRREAGFPAVRHPGEEPTLAGARARRCARGLSQDTGVSPAPAAARLQTGQDRPGEGDHQDRR